MQVHNVVMSQPHYMCLRYLTLQTLGLHRGTANSAASRAGVHHLYILSLRTPPDTSDVARSLQGPGK